MAATSQCLAARRPGRLPRGSRIHIHTFPDALATSIAFLFDHPFMIVVGNLFPEPPSLRLSSTPIHSSQDGLPRASVKGTENLTACQSDSARPFQVEPRHRAHNPQKVDRVGGQPDPISTPARRHRRGHGLMGHASAVWGMSKPTRLHAKWRLGWPR